MDRSLLTGHLRSGPARSSVFGGSALDKKLALHLVRELNNLRRQTLTYPKGHPALVASVQRLMKMFDDLFATNSTIVLTVSDKLTSPGEVCLDRKNPMFRELASLLFDNGLLSVTFTKDTTQEELISFADVLGWRKEKIREEGGIDALLSRAEVRHITAQKVDQKAVRIKEYTEGQDSRHSEPRTGDEAWVRFARALITAQIIPDGNTRLPEGLARSLNSQLSRLPELMERANGNVLRELKTYDWDALVKTKRSMDKLQEFLDRLEPKFCAQLLMHFSVALAERPSAAEEVLGRFPVEAIILALSKQAVEGLAAPPAIMNILVHLTPQGARPSRPEVSPDVSSQFREREYEMYDRFRAVLQEEDSDEYVQEDYNLVLQTALKAENIRPSGLIGSAELKNTLLQPRIERHFCLVALELVDRERASNPSDCIKAKFSRICSGLLSYGDFTSLLQVLDHGRSFVEGPARRMFDEILTATEFVRRMTESLDMWDKATLPEAGRLIVRIGAPFVEPLLRRLADEERRYLRHFIMDQLIALGPLAMEGVLARIYDDRWHFVRSLVTILGSSGDPAVCQHLRRLSSHTHYKVRHEVIRALQHYGDPDATPLLMAELESDDPRVRVDAVKIAAKSPDPAVRSRIVGIVRSGGLSGTDLECRIAAVRALSDIGDPSVMPDLAHVLRSRSLFHGNALAKLKHEILKSLMTYPPREAAALLREMADSGRSQVADTAAAMLRNPRYLQ